MNWTQMLDWYLDLGKFGSGVSPLLDIQSGGVAMATTPGIVKVRPVWVHA